MNQITSMLNKKISKIRVFIYLFLAIFVFFICYLSFWVGLSYTDTDVRSFYTEAPKKPIASLYLLPSRGVYKTNEEFIIDIMLNTKGSNINAVAAFLNYDKNKMEVQKVDLSQSVFPLTAQNQVIKEQGKIKIVVSQPNPGVNAYEGKVASIKFKALEQTNPIAENLNFDFTKGSNLFSAAILNSPKGENILDMARGAKIYINQN